MIAVEEALSIILAHKRKFPTISIPLKEAVGKVLNEDIYADRDFPPFDRVTMDGIAINFASYKSGQRRFKINGVGAAGSPRIELSDKEACVEIMTGAMLAKGADTIIRYEDVTLEDDYATVNIDTVKFAQNVHFKGEDRKQGDLVIAKNRRLSPAEIGVLATVGKTVVQVADLPKTVIISTGDELVEINQVPLEHQIRKSNVHRLQASLKEAGFDSDTLHLVDDDEVIYQKMEQVVSNYGVILLSGGVSKGKFDFIPKVMEQLEVEKLFHRIAQRPGKPFWFGKWKDQALVFAFPGNPVSSFLNMEYYFKNWLNACLNVEAFKHFAVLGADINFKPNLTYFAQVKLEMSENAEMIAKPMEGHGSGDLANLTDADAFIILPPGKEIYKKGEIFEILPFKSL
jgi:molybdopterin molybdotransferase